MKSNRIIFFPLILVTLLLSSFSAYADGETSMVMTDKTATYDYTTHQGIITLDTFVTGYVKLIHTARPADIVMILDFSSSMKNVPSGGKTKKSVMMQKAASDFVDAMATSANNNNVDHRIGIITFGTGAHIQTDFLSVKGNTTNVSTLKSYINATCPAENEGSTRYDLAMILAKNMIDGGYKIYDIPQQLNVHSAKSDTYTKTATEPEVKLETGTDKCKEKTLLGTNSNNAPFIIFLTDGEPTGSTYLGHLGMFGGQGSFTTIDTPSTSEELSNDRYGSSSSWNSDHMFGIANHAIKTSRYLKKDKNVSVYSIQLGTPATKTKAALCEDALTAISSLYVNAERYRKTYWGDMTVGSAPYYQHITTLDQASISGAFDEISSSIEKVIGVEYGAETVMNDFINNSYFRLSDAVDPDNPWASIRLFTVECTGVDPGGERTFSEAPADTTELYESSGIILNIVKATTEGANDQISVKGYDYSENWCGVDEHGAAHGRKLLVKIPFTFTATGTVPSTVNTNGPGSGIYPALRDENGDIIIDPETGEPTYDTQPEEEYISPTISFCSLTITRVGLDKGESAIYEVFTGEEGNIFAARVSLNGTAASSVSKTLYGLQGGIYTVKEKGWNWAYNKTVYSDSGEVSGDSLTKTVDNPSEVVEFKFGGAHKTGTGPEDLHNHDEEYKVNAIDLSGLVN